MRDDFSALDLFSAARGKKSAARKKLLGLPRREVRKSARKLPLTAALMPLLAKMNKMKKTSSETADLPLQGWPVSLSWSAPQPDVGRDAYKAYPLGYSS